MENQDVLKTIAVLADKLGRYHERLMVTERELETHLKNCQKFYQAGIKTYDEIAKLDYKTKIEGLREETKIERQGSSLFEKIRYVIPRGKRPGLK